MPKKSNRLSARTLNLGEFLKLDCKSEQDSSILGQKVINWYEKAEDNSFDGKVPDKISQIILPTAPKKSFNVTADDINVPMEPPYKLVVSNLPFKGMTANILRPKFKNVKHIKMDTKGFAYVEFYNRSDLIEALNMSNVHIGDRLVYFDVFCEQNTSWKFAKPVSVHKSKYNDELNWRDKSNSESCSGKYTTRDIPHRQRPMLQLKPRSELSVANESLGESNVKRERQKLNLAPRTKPIENQYCDKSRNSSIFGQAIPVDTAAKQQNIEKLLLKKTMEGENEDPKKTNDNIYE